MNLKSIIAAAVAGFFSAAIVDVNAWSKSDGNFDWRLAVKRWIAGALSGVLSGSGIGLLPVE